MSKRVKIKNERDRISVHLHGRERGSEGERVRSEIQLK